MLSSAEIESAEPDAWTGKPTALVYQDETAVAAFLSKRGMTAFSGSTAEEQEQALIVATERAEDEVRPFFRGTPVSSTSQRLLFPAYYAYDDTGELIPADSAPDRYLEGISRIAEKIRAGAFMPYAGAGPISREATRRGSITYRDSGNPESFQVNHPDIWKMLRSAIRKML